MKEKKQITISIAGQTFVLQEPPESTDAIRRIESELNRLWGRWCNDFGNQNPQQVLAMVAFQYARFYYNMSDSLERSQQAIADFENQLDRILLDVERSS